MHLHKIHLILFIFTCRAFCVVTTEQLPMTLWLPADAGTGWTRYPTWHSENMDGSQNLDYPGVLDVAHMHYNWLITQQNHLTTLGSCLVAVMWDPISQQTFASSIPQGPRKSFMTIQVQSPNNLAPLWFAQANTIFTTGKQPGSPTPIHAEDGVFFNWETSKDAITTDNLYPPGSIIAVWGKFPKDSEGHEVGLCKAVFTQLNNGGYKGRTPPCQTVAFNLGVGYAGNLPPGSQPAPPPQPPVVDDESDYSDENSLTQEDFDDAMAACGASLPQGDTLKRRGTVIPENIRRDATGTEATATITNAACAFVLPTPVTAGTITSLPTTDYNLPISVAAGPVCGTNLGQAPCPTPDCGDNLGEIPCSSASPPTTTTSINWDTTVTAPLQATATGCNDVEECDEDENNDRPSCTTADDCDAPCRAQFANNSAALQYGYASTCVDQAFCTCSVEAAEVVGEILIEIGEVVCAVWNSAIPAALGLLQFVVPYIGELAEGAEADEFFEAADQVLKKGSKDCNAVCSENADGQKFTAVDALDDTTWAGIFACDDESVPPAATASS